MNLLFPSHISDALNINRHDKVPRQGKWVWLREDDPPFVPKESKIADGYPVLTHQCFKWDSAKGLERVEMGFRCHWSLDPAAGGFQQDHQNEKSGFRRQQGAPAPKSTFSLI